MFGSNVLDTVIALVFVFLGVSLVCTAINELIAIAFASRARDLERGIRNILDGTSAYPLRWWKSPIYEASRKKVEEERKSLTPWAEAFFNHQLINGTQKDGQKPSYVPSQDFVNVLIHLVNDAAKIAVDAAGAENQGAAGGNAAGANGGANAAVANADNAGIVGAGIAAPGQGIVTALNGQSTFSQIRAVIEKINAPKIKEMLLPIVLEAESDSNKAISDFKKFNDRVEIWYDHAMDRVGGWYKKRTQWILLLIAVIVVATMNIDTIAIYQRLARDGTLRTSIVAAAQKASNNAGSGTTQPTTQSVSEAIENVKGSLQNFDQLGIPIGWSQAEVKSANTYLWLSKICGLLATAIAASLGAPFWFDILNKFMAVRGTGKAPEEKPKDPKVVPQPQTPRG